MRPALALVQPLIRKTLARPLEVSPEALQRAQEVQYLLLLRGAEVGEILLHRSGFAAPAGMGLNRRQQVRAAAIVQQEDSLPQTPQRSGAELVAAGAALRHVVG